ncbi:MAG: hypothetical protein JOZ19_07955 [Rubrobacter sp.]|nr:hypothetical protein [Rubrobacter sp.]
MSIKNAEKGLFDKALKKRRMHRSRWWMLARKGSGYLELLSLERGTPGSVLPVFSFKEEAEMFCLLEELDEGWEVRESSPGELTSVLYGPCVGTKSVALDPLPEKVADGAELGLMCMRRERFLNRLLDCGTRR